MDPIFGGITSIASIANSFIQGKREADIAKDQIKLAKQALKLQDIQESQRIATERAIAMAEGSWRSRNNQVYALYAVGGVAAIVSVLLVASALRKKA